MYRSKSGFTLIEMMIVLVIAGILFFVALPAYQNSVLKSRRSAAKIGLADIMSRQEQYFINNKAYATGLAALGFPDPYYVDGQAQESPGAGNRVYKLELVLNAAKFESARAIPQNSQTKDTRCGNFVLNVSGAKSNSGGGSVSECW